MFLQHETAGTEKILLKQLGISFDGFNLSFATSQIFLEVKTTIP